MLTFHPVEALSPPAVLHAVLEMVDKGFGLAAMINFQSNELKLIASPHMLSPRLYVGYLKQVQHPEAIGPPTATIVAMGVLHLASVWSINAVTVHPNHRKRGYGTAIISFLADELENLLILDDPSGFIVLTARAELRAVAVRAGFRIAETDKADRSLMVRRVPFSGRARTPEAGL